jgi:hypothetical protein
LNENLGALGFMLPPSREAYHIDVDFFLGNRDTCGQPVPHLQNVKSAN